MLLVTITLVLKVAFNVIAIYIAGEILVIRGEICISF